MKKVLRTALVVAGCCTATLASAQARAIGDHTFYGTIISTQGGTWEGPGGLYAVLEGDPFGFELKAEEPRAYGGGTYGNHTFYAINYTEEDGKISIPFVLSTYNAAMGWSWEKDYGSYDFSSIASDLTFDPKSGRLYGCFYNEDYTDCKTFGYIEFDKPAEHFYQSHAIAQLPERMLGLATNAEGTVYGIGLSGALYTISKLTGETQKVGMTSLTDLLPFYQSAVCDQKTGDIFFAGMYGDYWDTSIFKINPTTAKTTRVLDTSWDNDGFDEQMTGLFLVEDIEGSATPIAPSNFELNFGAFDVNGTASFILPTKMTDGTAISGFLEYAIMDNGELLVQDEGGPGDKITESLHFETSALHNLTVSCMVKNSVSDPATTLLWIGYDEAEAPTNLKAKVTGMDVNLTWNAPTKSKHNGYFDADHLTYTITRNPGNVLVAENVKTTSYTDRIQNADLTSYSYSVAAVNGGVVGDAATVSGIQVGTTDALPSAISDLVIVPGEKGALEANVTFTAPATTIDESELTAPLDFSIVRGSETVTTLTGVTPGTKVCYTDKTIDYNGTYTYTVTPSYDNKTGESTKASAYIGLDYPGPVQHLKAREDFSAPGTVVLTWDAPTVGQHGGYVDPANLSYYVSYGTQNDEAFVGQSRTYRDPLDTSKGQVYQAYSVYAVNSAGSGRNVWQTVVALVGDPLPLPFSESFPKISMKDNWLPEIVAGEIGEAWWMVSDGSQIGGYSADNDGGMFEFSAETVGKASRISSPRIDISKAAKPQVSFWNYFTGKTDQLELDICVDDEDYVPVQTIVANEQPIGWHRIVVDLSPYRNSRFIKLGFVGRAVESTASCLGFDNVIFMDAGGIDLQIEQVAGPSSIKSGEKGMFGVYVRNLSDDGIEGDEYKVVLVKNGRDVNTVGGETLNMGETASIYITDEAQVIDPENSQYAIRIDCESDENTANNLSETMEVEIICPNYPAPTNPSGYFNETACLTWDKPDFMHQAAQATTDGFDTYNAWLINNFGGWTTYDGDGQKTIRMSLDSFGVIEYPGAGEANAYQIFCSAETAIPFSSWDPCSGENMLVAMKCASPDNGKTEIANDDWLISPELDGTAQTITFMAKAGMNGSYIPETYEFLYSTGSTDAADFKKIGETVEVSNVSGWAKFKHAVPEGAKRFAIRHTSYAKFAFMLDDITFIPEGAEREQLDLQGYNVYRADAEGYYHKLNESVIAPQGTPEGFFRDTNAEDEKTYTYRFSAVYQQGESVPCEPFTITYSAAGIEMILTPAGAQHYYNLQGQRVRRAEGNGVYIVNGQKIVK